MRTDPRRPGDDRYCALKSEIRNLRWDKHGSRIKSDIHRLYMPRSMLLGPVVRISYKGWRRTRREIVGTVITKPHFRLVRITKVEKRALRCFIVAAHHLPLRVRMICFRTVDKMRNLYPRSLAISLRDRGTRELTQNLQER